MTHFIKSAASMAFFLVLLLAPSKALSQTYTVYDVSKDVMLKNGKVLTEVKVGQELNEATVVRLKDKESKLVLIDQANNKKYTCKTAGSFTVGTLISKGKVSAESLTKSYVKFLLRQLTDNKSHYHGDTSLTVNRSDDDTLSVAIDTLSPGLTVPDTLSPAKCVPDTLLPAKCVPDSLPSVPCSTDSIPGNQ